MDGQQVNIPVLPYTAMEGRRSESNTYGQKCTSKCVGIGTVGKSADLAET